MRALTLSLRRHSYHEAGFLCPTKAKGQLLSHQETLSLWLHGSLTVKRILNFSPLPRQLPVKSLNSWLKMGMILTLHPMTTIWTLSHQNHWLKGVPAATHLRRVRLCDQLFVLCWHDHCFVRKVVFIWNTVMGIRVNRLANLTFHFFFLLLKPLRGVAAAMVDEHMTYCDEHCVKLCEARNFYYCLLSSQGRTSNLNPFIRKFHNVHRQALWETFNCHECVSTF